MVTPLSPIRIVTTAINVPGPLAAARLAGMGAQVVKVEPPTGDPLAAYDAEWYKALAKDQEIITLDLKSDAGKSRLYELLETADLLLTAQRPSAMQRLGLDWPRLHNRFPRLCHVAIVGHAVPDEELPGHDLTYCAAVGLVSPPTLPPTLIADLAGAERAVSEALRLLLIRERTGIAGCAQVALADAAAFYAEPLRRGITRPESVLGGGVPDYGCYATRDGYLAVATLETHFAQALRRELGLEADTREALQAAFLTRTAAEWETWARAKGLPICKIHIYE